MYQIISEDRNTVMVFDCNVMGTPNCAPGYVLLQGLDAKAIYEDVQTGAMRNGDTLMNVGIPTDSYWDMDGFIRVFRKL